MLFDDMRPWVMPSVISCPEELAIQALQESATEFVRRTGSIAEMRTVTIGAGASVALGTLALPVIDVLSARVAGESVAVLAIDDEAIENLASDEYVLTWDGDAIATSPALAVSISATMRLLTGLAPTATGIPDIIWSKNYTCLVHGALGNLMAMPDKPWTSAGAAFHLSEFERLTKQAAADIGRNNKRTARRMRVKSA